MVSIHPYFGILSFSLYIHYFLLPFNSVNSYMYVCMFLLPMFSTSFFNLYFLFFFPFPTLHYLWELQAKSQGACVDFFTPSMMWLHLWFYQISSHFRFPSTSLMRVNVERSHSCLCFSTSLSLCINSAIIVFFFSLNFAFFSLFGQDLTSNGSFC